MEWDFLILISLIECLKLLKIMFQVLLLLFLLFLQFNIIIKWIHIMVLLRWIHLNSVTIIKIILLKLVILLMSQIHVLLIILISIKEWELILLLNFRRQGSKVSKKWVLIYSKLMSQECQRINQILLELFNVLFQKWKRKLRRCLKRRL